jgi:hypothetical protein
MFFQLHEIVKVSLSFVFDENPFVFIYSRFYGAMEIAVAVFGDDRE